MGNFQGHLLPCILFGLWGMWTCYNLWLRWFLCRRLAQSGPHAHWRKSRHRATSCDAEKQKLEEDSLESSEYQSSLVFNFSWCRGKPVLPEMLLMFFVVFGCICELIDAYIKEIFGPPNLQHIMMFIGFGGMPVLVHLRRRGFPLPLNVEYLVLSSGFALQGFLLYFHTHGRNMLDVRIHMFLVYACALCSVSTVYEMMYKSSVLPALCRCFAMLLQSSWFVQIGFFLYSPFGTIWDPAEHHTLMWATLLFTVHWMQAIGAVAGLGQMAYRTAKGMSEEELSQWVIGEQHLRGCTTRPLAEGKDGAGQYLVLPDGTDDEA